MNTSKWIATKKEQITRDAKYNREKLGMNWLKAANEYSESNPESLPGTPDIEIHKPATWTDDQFYRFLEVESLRKQYDILNGIEDN